MTMPTRRDDLKALTAYHSPQLDVRVRLNTNESPFPPPTGFVDAWADALRTVPLNRYPDRNAVDLRRELARTVGCDPANLFCANGSNEVLQTLLMTYGGPGRAALVCEPTYALHAHLSNLTGTEVMVVERESDFSTDIDRLIASIAVQRPNIVFICSPNNPTGTQVPLGDVERTLEACESIGALLIVDEAYVEFSDDNAAALVAEDRNLVVSRTYSKVWSLAAVRLGFAIAPTWVVEELDLIVPPYHLSAATQLAGLHALRFTAEMTSRVGMIVEERERLITAIGALPGIEVFPSGANFFLMRVPGAGHALWEALAARGVMIRDFAHMPGLTDCVRVTVGSPAENDMFLSALRAVCSDLEIGG